MTKDECAAICKDRLDTWREHLVRDHATPAILIGIGHDHESGNLSLSTVSNLSDAEIKTILIGVYRRLGGRA